MVDSDGEFITAEGEIESRVVEVQKKSHTYTRSCGLFFALINNMENLKFPVLFTTFYLLIYTLLPYFGAGLEIMALLFIFSPFVLVWMVIRILKGGKPSGKKFNDGHWYDDWDYLANPEN